MLIEHVYGWRQIGCSQLTIHQAGGEDKSVQTCSALSPCVRMRYAATKATDRDRPSLQWTRAAPSARTRAWATDAGASAPSLFSARIVPALCLLAGRLRWHCRCRRSAPSPGRRRRRPRAGQGFLCQSRAVAAARTLAQRVPATNTESADWRQHQHLPQGIQRIKQQTATQPLLPDAQQNIWPPPPPPLTFSKKLATPPSVRGGVALSTYRMLSRRSSARSLAEAFPDTYSHGRTRMARMLFRDNNAIFRASPPRLEQASCYARAATRSSTRRDEVLKCPHTHHITRAHRVRAVYITCGG